MWSQLLSIIKFPFNHMAASFGFITAITAIKVVGEVHRERKDFATAYERLLSIDNVAANVDLPYCIRNCAKKVQILKMKLPPVALQNLTKIAFCSIELGTAANDVLVFSTGENYMLQIGYSALAEWTDQEMLATMAHELFHVKENHLNSFHYALLVLREINKRIFMPIGFATLVLSVKSMFFRSKQMPAMLAILMASAMVGQICKMWNHRCEFQADQGIKHLGQEPHALISALRKSDELDRILLNLPPKDPNAKPRITYDRFFPSYPSIEARQKALGISEEVSNRPAVLSS